jgi:hypothetical protein
MKKRYYYPSPPQVNDPDDFAEMYQPWCREDAEIAFDLYMRWNPKSVGHYRYFGRGIGRFTGRSA